MGYQRAHHKKKGKCEASQIAHAKPFIQVHGKPVLSDQMLATLEYFGRMDKVMCCPTDTCNNGKDICDGSCKEWGRN
jgi:hypothetical protein